MPTPPGVPVEMTSPGRERHRVADVLDEAVDVEDELLGVRGLLRLAVDPQGDVRRVRVEAVALRERRPHRRERVVALPAKELAVVELGVPPAHVVDDGVAHDVLLGVGGVHAVALAAGDDPQFDLVVDPFDPGGRRIGASGWVTAVGALPNSSGFSGMGSSCSSAWSR